MPRKKRQPQRISKRYGAAELFGRAVSRLDAKELRVLSSSSHRDVTCPFKPDKKTCHKQGGVCSLVLYERQPNGNVSVSGTPITTCPSRFAELDTVSRWVGETLLGTPTPKVVSEVGFLMAADGQEVSAGDEVGSIDNVLVHTDGNRLAWCALEKQAVYFSGGKMEADFITMRTWTEPSLPFPGKHRRPDFRSSGPKRLMPQLQTKVPTLRRWGKKMAVVVDNAFWNSLRGMRQTPDLSNADIIWFVVDYEGPTRGRYILKTHEKYFTTLENAVEGLTGGTPVSLEQFERSIKKKLERVGAS